MTVVEIALQLAVSLADTSGAADSAAAVRDARRATTRFETTRRRLLPDRPSFGASMCEVQIGRFCISGLDDTSTAPPEPESIAAARRLLVQTLDTVAARIPGDAWVAGHRVWYYIEAGDTTTAVEAARRCRAERWWCLALEGLALHVARRDEAADSAFSLALAAMPERQRCEWERADVLIDARLPRLGCAERRAIQEHIWWLADPAHSVPGNDLRAEHYSRWTYARLQELWRPTHALGWGADLRELTLRYGWPTAWSRDRSRERVSAQPGLSEHITGHEPSPGFHSFPAMRAIERWQDARLEDWTGTMKHPRSRYRPAYATHVRPIAPQIATFRRGDSLLLIAAFELPADSAGASDTVDAALVAAAGPASAPPIARARETGRSGVLQLMAPDTTLLASVEVFDSGPRLARARASLGRLDRDGALSISDLLLVEPGPMPATLEEALPRALPTPRVQRREDVVLLWEVYGLASDAAQSLKVTLAVSRVRASRGRRLAERLRLADRPTPVVMGWEAHSTAHQGITVGTLALSLRDRTPGVYRLEVRVVAPDGRSVGAGREIEIRDKN